MSPTCCGGRCAREWTPLTWRCWSPPNAAGTSLSAVRIGGWPPSGLVPAGHVPGRPEEERPEPAGPVGVGLLQQAAGPEALDEQVLGRVVHVRRLRHAPPPGTQIRTNDRQVDAGEPVAGGRVPTGRTVSCWLSVVPRNVALTVPVSDSPAGTGVVRIVNVPLLSPGRMVTVAGLLAAWSVVLRLTTSPSGGAGSEITTVPVTALQPATVDCFNTRLAQSPVNSATYAVG